MGTIVELPTSRRVLGRGSSEIGSATIVIPPGWQPVDPRRENLTGQMQASMRTLAAEHVTETAPVAELQMSEEQRLALVGELNDIVERIRDHEDGLILARKQFDVARERARQAGIEYRAPHKGRVQ